MTQQALLEDKAVLPRRWSFALVSQAGVQWCSLSSLKLSPSWFKRFSCLSLPTECPSVAQAGVQRCNLSSLFKRLSCLSHPSSWDHRPVPPCRVIFVLQEFYHVTQSGLELLTSCDLPPRSPKFSDPAPKHSIRHTPRPCGAFSPTPHELWEAEVGGSLEVRSSRPAWPTWRNPVSTENTKISQAWWHEPVIPTTWEAEAGELFEPESCRLQLEYNGIILARRNLRILGSKTGFLHVGQAGLKLLSSGDPPTSASQSVGITGHFGRLKRVDPLSPGVRDQSGRHGETLSLSTYILARHHA
ncbi:hypothetical protein AAY473_039330 [Plecturocebus cupreus]